MDFEGQKLAELIFHILIISFGAVGWVIGYFQQDFTIVFQAWLVGLVLSVIVRKENDEFAVDFDFLACFDLVLLAYFCSCVCKTSHLKFSGCL